MMRLRIGLLTAAVAAREQRNDRRETKKPSLRFKSKTNYCSHSPHVYIATEVSAFRCTVLYSRTAIPSAFILR
jgi:hypothetical protein